MKNGLNLFLALLIVSGCVFSNSASAAKETLPKKSEANPSATPEQLVQKVLNAAKENYKKLGPVELNLNYVFENLTVKKEITTVTKSKGGGTVTFTLKPRHELNAKAVIGGKNFRYDLSIKSKPYSQTLYFDGHLWTEFLQPRNVINIRRTNQMPGKSSIDPRDPAGKGLKHPLENDLLNKTPLHAKYVGVQGASTTGNDIQIEFASAGGNRYRIYFDEKFDYLPSRFVLFHLDRSILSDKIIDYQRVKERKAWILNKTVRRGYKKGVAHGLTAKGWSFVATVQVKKIRLLSEEEGIRLLMVPPFPPGMRVHNIY
jgi:hypothetical protein